jgi:hypothetical protein
VIANLINSGWEIIYHRAHALLAAQIAGYWDTADDTAHLVEIVAAIAHHDDLEREWEGNHLTKAGAPLDFTLDQSLSTQQLRQHVENAIYRGRWVAMLTSMHMSFLHEGRRGESSEVDKFLDEQLERQKQWRKDLGLTKSEAEKAYTFMRWCDRLSLILCQRQLPDSQRALEITHGPNGKRYDVIQRGDNTIAVVPWPFRSDDFSVRVDAAYLSEVSFDSNEAFIATLKEAPMRTIQWQFQRQAETKAA